jgi:hypothetical protein
MNRHRISRVTSRHRRRDARFCVSIDAPEFTYVRKFISIREKIKFHTQENLSAYVRKSGGSGKKLFVV